MNVGTRIWTSTFPTNDSNIEKYCYNNDEANCTTYGGLYNWNKALNWVNDEGAQGICPVGSHIPSDNDWKILEMQLGMTKTDADMMGESRGSDQGAQLKSGGSAGLDIKFSGIRYGLGSFDYIDIANILITSTEDSSVNVKARQLHVDYNWVSRTLGAKTTGFSVRCLGN